MIKLHSRIVLDGEELKEMTEPGLVHAYIKRKAASDLGRGISDLADGAINVVAHELPDGDVDYNLSVTVITEEERQEYQMLRKMMFQLRDLLGGPDNE